MAFSQVLAPVAAWTGWISKDVVQYIGLSSEPTARPHLQAVRLQLGFLVALMFAKFHDAVAKRFDSTVATMMTLLTATQFHFVFYSSRPLGNIFALLFGNYSCPFSLAYLTILVLQAYAHWLDGKISRVVCGLTVTAAVFRYEVVLLAGPIFLTELLFGKLKLGNMIQWGASTALLAVCVSVVVL
jgi:alpha-1,6-mannosyltransferase